MPFCGRLENDRAVVSMVIAERSEFVTIML